MTRRQAQLDVVRHRMQAGPSGPQNCFLNEAVQSTERDVEAQGVLAEEFRRCARCGVDDFTQRPLPR